MSARDLSRCADLSGARLYRRNAFAVTGLPADAQGRVVRRHRDRLETRLAIEETWNGAADSPLAGGYRVDEVRAAFEEFKDPRRRLVDELLWLWGDADLGCGCPRRLHDEHDAAVRCHALALEPPSTSDDRHGLWQEAALRWQLVLCEPEFARHIAHRMAALDDRRLGAHTADDFLGALPRLLVSPFGELALDPAFLPRLARSCEPWAAQEVFAGLFTELFEETVRATTQRINEQLLAAGSRMEARAYDDAVPLLWEQVVPAFDRLTGLRPFVSDREYEETARAVAVGFNNLAVALQGRYMRRRPTRAQRARVLGLAQKAYAVAPQRDAKRIKANWSLIERQFSGGYTAPPRPASTGDLLAGAGCLLVPVSFGLLWAFLGPAAALLLAFGAGLLALFVSVVVGAARYLMNDDSLNDPTSPAE